MAVALIDRLLTHLDPAFACYANGDKSMKEAYFAPLIHLANPTAKSALLEHIPDVPGTKDAFALYLKYNGVLLYSERDVDAHGLEIFPIEAWEERTRDNVDSWLSEFHHYPDDDMPYGHNDFISFAHCRGASNYVHWVTRGHRAGSVYWWPWTNRPEQHTPPMAETFSSFIELVFEQPAYFFNELLSCYTRFTDGSTPIEWLPKRYLPDQQDPSNGW